MTREKIQAMVPGEEMDALVAEKCLGRLVTWNRAFMYMTEEERNSTVTGAFLCIPEYSTDISAAWEVVEKILERSEWIGIDTNADGYRCIIRVWENDEPGFCHEVHGKNSPEAICKAALLTVMEVNNQ